MLLAHLLSFSSQAYQVWHNHGSWVSQHESSITPGILDRFKSASSITKEQYTAADGKRHLIKKHMQQLLGSDGLLALPTAPGPAVLLNTPADRLAEWGKATLSLTCIAGLAGLPQVGFVEVLVHVALNAVWWSDSWELIGESAAAAAPADRG